MSDENKSTFKETLILMVVGFVLFTLSLTQITDGIMNCQKQRLEIMKMELQLMETGWLLTDEK
jgi:hypothetical protein